MVVTGLAASWHLSLIAAAAYLCIGVLLPRFFSRRMAETGMRYRRELGDFGAYFLDSIKGIREVVLYNAGETRAAEVDRRSDAMLGRTKTLKRETALSAAATEAAVSLSVLAVLAVGIFLVRSGSLSAGRMVLGVTAVADTLPDAVKLAYERVEKVSFGNEFHRTDIGKRALAAEV